MPPLSEAATNHGEGSGDDNWGDASIELTPNPERGCHCHCQSGCNCGCASCMARVDTVSDESTQATYPGEGGPSGVVPSEPVNIPNHTSCHEHREFLDELTGIESNSVEAASPPLTHENLLILARSASHSSTNEGALAKDWLGTSNSNHDGMLSENDVPMSDFTDAMSLDESVFVEVGQRSLSMSMISEYSHAFTRSSPSASIYLAGLRTSYIHTPLPLVAECTHAPSNRRCGCYCRM